MKMSVKLDPYSTALKRAVQKSELPRPSRVWGRIAGIRSQSIQVVGLADFLGLGDMVFVEDNHKITLRGEVISLEDGAAIVMMHGRPAGLRVGQKVFIVSDDCPKPSDAWLGLVLDSSGCAIDGLSPPKGRQAAPLKAKPPAAILRKPLGPRLNTGIAAIDTFLPMCRGQRLGLFAGSGVGKSTLLGEISKGSDADINIVALIGERGREVRHFVEDTLGPEAMKKTVVFVATSDELSALKIRTALLAMATAEYFRDQGRQVLFLFDSVTRYAEAHRDLALTAGEVPSLHAYPPSTFGALAALCERAGPGLDGSGDITAVFSVLVAGSDMEEPVADMVRGILDGHLVLDRDIAERGRYPAINLSKSISRSLPAAATEAENHILIQARRLVMQYENSKTLIQAGLYVPGTDPSLDKAVAVYEELDSFMSLVKAGSISEKFAYLETLLKAGDEAIEDNEVV